MYNLHYFFGNENHDTLGDEFREIICVDSDN